MYKQLIPEQRYEISALLKTNTPKKEIAEAVGCHISTIYREINRNSTKRGSYSGGSAQERCNEKKERIRKNPTISSKTKFEALKKLRDEQWSPEQISGYFKRSGIKISHTTIYKYVYEDKKNGGDLWDHLRHDGRHRKRDPYAKASSKNIKGRISIHNRPKEADGTRFGDWEMDLIVGKDGFGAILTLVERFTGYVIIRRLKHGKKAKALAEEVARLLLAYKAKGVLTITTDNGGEFARHDVISKKLGGVGVYFADPYSSWQKGLVENTNKLIRQYIPKKTDFDTITDKEIMEIQKKLNRRPRKKLGFSTPLKEFFKHFD